ncbi:MAG: hypothetical protein WB802_05810 [Candidatus Dormiibacterota bacterium]|jgi:hypothetical protein
MTNLAGLAALLSLAFALVVATRWLRSHRPSFAFWTLGLLIFAAAATAQSLGEAQGFEQHVALFRVFYLLGGALGVIYLALGTLYLLAPRRVADVSALVLLALTVVVAVDAFVEPVDAARLATPCGLFGGAYSSAAPIALAAVLFNIVGTLVFVGGAAWSGWRFLREGTHLDRIVCNVCLTAGALVIAAGFSAAKIATATGHCTVGSLDYLGAYEAIGMAVMFVGFLSLGSSLLRSPRRSTLPRAGVGTP